MVVVLVDGLVVVVVVVDAVVVVVDDVVVGSCSVSSVNPKCTASSV